MSEFIQKLKMKVCDELPECRQWEGDQERTVRDTIDYLHSQNLIVQEGEVSVPKAPSEKQIDAALEYCDGYNSKYFLGLYRVMIAAATDVQK